ncbi:hypothetical protein D3C80_1379380 [compost metagenome]
MQSRPLPVYSRLPLRCNLPPLLEALQRIPADAWQEHFNSAYYQGDWSGVALIYAEDAPLPLAPGLGAPRRSAWGQGRASMSIAITIWASRVATCVCISRCSVHRAWNSCWTVCRCRCSRASAGFSIFPDRIG